MQNYSDSRTVFIKNLLRYYLYKTHFYRSDGAEMKVADDVDKKSSILGEADGKMNDHDVFRGAGHADLNSNEPPVLSKPDEEIITELTYKMQEFFYPQYDLIYNKGDDLDGIIFILEGEVNVTLRSSHS